MANGRLLPNENLLSAPFSSAPGLRFLFCTLIIHNSLSLLPGLAEMQSYILTQLLQPSMERATTLL